MTAALSSPAAPARSTATVLQAISDDESVRPELGRWALGVCRETLSDQLSMNGVSR